MHANMHLKLAKYALKTLKYALKNSITSTSNTKSVKTLTKFQQKKEILFKKTI